MQEECPRISVIIPAPPGVDEPLSVQALRRLVYPADKLEVWLANGRHPSVQRNKAAASATGDWLYFLDDDSQVDPLSLRNVRELMLDPQVAVIGGPNLCPVEAPCLHQAFFLIMSSWLTFGPSRARYVRAGQARATSEKELILCNLMMRRTLFEQQKGFDEALYPNEENALMDRIQDQGLRLMYHPDLVVRRSPRKSIPEFLRMLFRYGRGRAEQVRRHPTAGSIVNFVPAAFMVYILAVGFLPLWAGLPLVGYMMAVAGQGLIWIARAAFLPALLAIPLIPLTHFFYGLGVWCGLFTRFRTGSPAAEVEVKRLW